MAGARQTLDTTRFTQWGAWEGTVNVDGVPLEVNLSVRDEELEVREDRRPV